MPEYNRKSHRVLFNLFFFLYLLILAFFLFRAHPPARSFSLVPFRAIWTVLTDDDPTLRAFALNKLLGNIALFVPMGVYFMVIRRRKRPLRCVVQIMLVSMSVELVQYFARMGIGDVDDVLLNTFGGYLGTLIYRALLSIFETHGKVRFAVSLMAPVAAAVFFLVLWLYK